MDRVITVISTPLYEAGVDQKTMYIALRDDATDAAPELRPLQRVPNRIVNNVVDHYEEAGDDLYRLWRTKLGRHLYEHVVKGDLKKEGIRRAFLLSLFLRSSSYLLIPVCTPQFRTLQIRLCSLTSPNTTPCGYTRKGMPRTRAQMLTSMVSHSALPFDLTNDT